MLRRVGQGSRSCAVLGAYEGVRQTAVKRGVLTEESRADVPTRTPLRPFCFVHHLPVSVWRRKLEI